MWKSWNPFKRKQKDSDDTTGELSGKENVNGKLIILDDSGFKNDNRYHGSNETDERTSESRQTNGSNDFNGITNKLPENDLSLLRSPLRLSSSRNRSAIAVQDQAPLSGINSSLHKSAQDFSGNNQTQKSKEESNKSFSGVYGPLLSSPIVPQVRRAVESNMGLRSSPQASKVPVVKPVGRSMSLNYGSHNPTKSTAGQLPWVRLKRKDSIGLNDLVNGNTPMSPNTVKLATPEHRHLPAAPSFKSTPLIITTEASRSCVVDTQTVVSALREKRKRFGATLQEESLNEDSWQSTAKRRRQDSSQSNASSVSMPSMPESLPNLIGSPGASLLHIENLADQRPSTVPAIDAFISHHHRMIGLGGAGVGAVAQPQQFYSSPQQPVIRNTNNSKTVYRSIRSSLSSSQRALATLSALNQHGIDTRRLRGLSQSSDSPIKTLLTTEKSVVEKSQVQPKSVLNIQDCETTPKALITPPVLSSMDSPAVSASPVSTTLANRQIAEGVLLRKHDLAVTPSSVLPVKAAHTKLLASASDYEMDRQREYQRRVLDLLDDDNTDGKDQSLMTSSSSPVANAVSTTTSNLSMSLAATSAAVSASLDSLNKLVQSATTPTQSNLTTPSTANSLSELLKPSKDNTSSQSSATVTSSLSLTGKPLDCPSSALPLQTSSASSSAAKSTVSLEGGFDFNKGVPAGTVPSGGSSFGLQPSKAEGTSDKPGLASNVGFNFTTDATTGTTASAGFTFLAPTSASVITNSSSMAPKTGANFGVSQGSQIAPAVVDSTKTPSTAPPVSSVNQGISFSSAAGSSLNPTGFSLTGQPGTQASGFDFNSGQVSLSGAGTASTNVSSAGGFTFGATGIAESSHPPGTGFGGSATFGTPNAGTKISASAAPGQSGFNSGGTIYGASAATVNFGQPSVTTAPPPFSTGQASSASTSAFGASAAVTTLSANSAPFTFTPSSTSSSVSPFTLGQPAVTTSGNTVTFGLGQTNTLPSSGSAAFNFGQTPTSSSGTPSMAFNFSQAPATTNVNSVSHGFGQPSTVNTPSLSFGQPTTSNVNTGLLNFGKMESTVSTASTSFGFTAPMTTANTGLFNLGQTAPPSRKSTVTFRQLVPETNSSTALFSFEQQAASTNSAIFSQTAPGSNSTAPFAFGQANSSSAPFNFGQTVTMASSTAPFAFGQAAATTAASTAPFAFGQMAATTAASTAPFAFGQTAATTAASTAPFAFGQMAATTASSTAPFAFGQTAATTASSTAPFAFGQTAATTASSTAPFAFGQAANSSAGKPFAFGASSTQPSVPSMFGSNQMASATSSSSAFGSTNTVTPTSSVFGSGSLTQGFGNTSSFDNSAFGGNAASGFNNPGFNTTSSSSMFGFAATTTAPAFGSTAPASSFGSSTTGGSIFGAPANKPFSFGSSTTSASSAPAFGTPTVSSTFGTLAPVASIFGAKPSTGSNIFGMTTTTTASSTFGTITSPGFGSASTTQQSGFGSTAPAFGSTQQSSVFGNPGLNQAPAFGSSGASSFGTQNQPSVFGSAANQPSMNFTGQPQPSSTFGSQMSNSASGFNFGQSTTQPAAVNAFNFSAQSTPRPTLPTPSPGGFNFSAMPTPGAFNFSATPATPQVASRPRAAARRPTRRGGGARR